jgi:hypothetical protein
MVSFSTSQKDPNHHAKVDSSTLAVTTNTRKENELADWLVDVKVNLSNNSSSVRA